MAKAPKAQDLSFLERLPVSPDSLAQLVKLREVIASSSERRDSLAKEMADTVEWVWVKPQPTGEVYAE